ncbi:adenylosuccinate synthase [Pullulanibacillus sp. KACC 23026]|uniref:adenylosuccinate synthase n=1 Tax=Pullulanibacillus sp. KACC 23026 TaxID=3028315 RepID=UPI0023AEFE34|nr:adenylosuccinate synthase [Pullulanibacillus sp. KACC 23026]WEG14425.1 adenylosuccinate synthase [Pullulanibacillus sp. KACC 23026]
MVKVILGAQWGDEGKGKMIDYLADQAEIVIRYQGGSNAGHTIVNEYGQSVLHLIPSGIFNPETKCVIGTGVVVHPEDLLSEINQLMEKGISKHQIEKQLMISERAHLVMPYHVVLDKLDEQKRRQKIGTTLKGIGPAYVDKVGRNGLQVGDLLHLEAIKGRVQEIVQNKNEIITKLYNGTPLEFDSIWNKLKDYREQLAPFIKDTQRIVLDAIKNKKQILAEGQLGVMRDLDWGAYPFVTSSNPIASAVGVGIGIPPHKINDVLGICKAYTTTVGEGEFITGLDDEVGVFLGQKGQEFGATTGRVRNCGWLDLPAVKYGAEINGYTGIALTKIDVLSTLSELKICTRYRHKETGERVDTLRPYIEMGQLEPVYETLPGWEDDLSTCRTYEDLPKNAIAYIEKIEQFLGVPIQYISVGSHREQTLIKE